MALIHHCIERIADMHRTHQPNRQEMDDAKDLPRLTHKQQKFVEGLLEGMTASDAYRQAYNAENMADNTIWCQASLLRSDPKVAKWLEAAKQAGFNKVVVTKETHLQSLKRLQEIALEQGDTKAALRAEELMGKVNGLYVDRFRDETPVTEEEIDRQLAELEAKEQAKPLH